MQGDTLDIRMTVSSGVFDKYVPELKENAYVMWCVELEGAETECIRFNQKKAISFVYEGTLEDAWNLKQEKPKKKSAWKTKKTKITKTKKETKMLVAATRYLKNTNAKWFVYFKNGNVTAKSEISPLSLSN